MKKTRWTVVALSADGENVRYCGGGRKLAWTTSRREADQTRSALGPDAEVVDAEWFRTHWQEWAEQAKARRAERLAAR